MPTIPTLTTFNGLAANIPIWCNRNDTIFIEQIPNFIALAQQSIWIDYPTMASQVYVQGTFVVGDNVISVPALWGSNLTFQYINTDFVIPKMMILQYVPPEYIDTFNTTSDGASTQSYPRYYTNMGVGYLRVSPTPASAYVFQIAYDTNSPLLNETQQTNFLTQQLFDLLFIRAMCYAWVFLDNQTNIQSWTALYEKRGAQYLLYNTGRKNDRTGDAEKD